MLKVRACRYGTMMFRVNDIYIGGSLAAYAEFSEGECELFRAWLRHGDTAIDVGANIGCHTVAMSRFVGETGKVVAFEPQRVPYQMLCGNVALNDLRNVWAYWAPCSWNHRPICVPDLPAGEVLNFGGMSLLEDHTSPVYEVEPIRIDDLGLDNVRLIKADVEGMELDVLCGGEVTIMRDLPILYVEADKPDRNPAVKAWLDVHNYQVWVHKPPLYNPQNYAGNQTNIYVSHDHLPIVSLNWICIHRDDTTTPRPDSEPI